LGVNPNTEGNFRPRCSLADAAPPRPLVKAWPWLIAAGLVALVAVVFWQVGSFAFINFDDDLYVYENPAVRGGLTREGIAWAFTAFHASNWHPLTWLSHMLDVELFGMDAGWHHRVNALFHGLNSVGLFIVLRRMTRATWSSALVAALFAVHPLHVESVAWVSERKDVLSTFFWVLTMGAYAWYVRRPSAGRWLATAAVFALGLLSKPMLVTLPLVLLLLDVWPLRRVGEGGVTWSALRPLVIEKLPLFAMSALSSAVTFVAQKQGGSVISTDAVTRGRRLGHAAVTCVGYLAKTLWPASLSMFYPYDAIALEQEPVALSVLVIVILTAIAVWQWRARPFVLIGWLWFLVTLAPVIGLVQVGNQAMADRYTYVPLIGIFVAMARTLRDLVKRGPVTRYVVGALATVVVLSAAWAARAQAGYWRDSYALYRHALAVTSRNWTAWNGLAYAYHGDGRLAEAVGAFQEALRVRPREAATWRDLGVTYARMNDHPAAIDAFRNAVQLTPDDAVTWIRLGASHGALGQLEHAAACFEEALRRRPGDRDALFDLGITFVQQRQLQRALEVQQRLERVDAALAARLLGNIRPLGAASP
jgi:Flp pilus assembly protein TadD